MDSANATKWSPQNSVVFGSMTDIPQEQKNVIRIFLSSTFSDMKVERNMLMSSIYPRLKRYCQETFKLEFQVVDMRWGVQDQALDDHSISELCTKEIYNCQKESAGPNFVCLLGDRYGTIYLKKIITEEHWTILVSRIISSEVKQLLGVWYKLDTNSVIPQRILQPISCVENGEEQWEKSSSIMYSALKDAAVQAKNDGELTSDIAQTFTRSVTEEEIDCAGMLSHTESENKPKCLAFIRRINSIDLQHGKAGRFIDIDDSKELNGEKQALLSKLKEQVKECIPPENVKEYSVNWSDAGGINAEEHKEYLNSFGEDFYDQVKRLVESAVERRDQSSKEAYENEVTREVLTHSKQALDKLSKVVPRSDILDKVKTYITGDSDRPLVVYGHSGCGKTSIMASIAKEAGQWLSAKEDKAETAVMLRFLGTTPSSSDIEHLLQSLITQLRMIIAVKSNIKYSKLDPESLTILINKFHNEIANYPANQGRLVILVDSIDQLRKSDTAFNLSWLPKTLPKNIRFVISTLPDIYGILRSAHSLDIPEDNFVEVKALDEKSAWTIIGRWLEMCSRKLTAEQHSVLAETFKSRSLPPLYIKLIFDILVKWTSYSQTSSIPPDVISCMDLLFTDLESTHGKVQVQLALAYLTCCPGGISETELEDVLSIDDVFLNAVYQYHIPPTRRIPPTLWVRMKNDIRDYLVEKESNGATAWFWYHRQFIEYTTRRYANEEGNNTRHCMDTICEYFTGKWSETPKSFTYTQQQMKKLNLSNPSASALRYVAPQPTRYRRHRFNARKISVLSQLWSNSIMKDRVYRNSAAYIMDIEFLTGKFVGDNWSNINTELSSLAEFMDDGQLQPTELQGSEEERYKVEFRYIHAVLKMYSGLISMAPLSLSSQLFACLQDKYNLSPPIPPSDTGLPTITWFLTQLTGGSGVEMSPLLPVSKILESPGGMQIISRRHECVMSWFSFTYHNKSALAVFAEEMVVYVLEDNGTVSELMSVIIPKGQRFGKLVSFGADENYIFAQGPYYFREIFCLISLESKRLELSSEQIDGLTEVLTWKVFHTVTVFCNPLVSGKDSIMFHALTQDFAMVFSFKLRKIVWQYSIPKKSETDKAPGIMYHASLRDTEESDRKILVIVFTLRTEFYEMRLLEDGDVEVTKQKEVCNAFADTDSESRSLVQVESDIYQFAGSSRNGQKQMHVILPMLPHGNLLILSDHVASLKGTWSHYELTRRFSLFMSGRLRNGQDLIAVYSEVSEGQHIVELYTATSHDSVTLSASIAIKGKSSLAYLVPQSDVFILLIEKMASVYFMSTQSPPLIDVIFAFEFEASSDRVDDLVANPLGFMTTAEYGPKCSKIWDLTAYTEHNTLNSNPRFLYKSTFRHRIFHLNSPDSSPLILHGAGHIFDPSTNENLVAQLPGNEDLDQVHGVLCTAGEGEWKHQINIVARQSFRVIGLNPPTEKCHVYTSKLIWKHSFYCAGDPSCVLYDTGMIALCGNDLVLHHLKLDQPRGEQVKSFKLDVVESKREANDSDEDEEDSGKDAAKLVLGQCYYADEIVVASLSEARYHSKARSRHILIYDTTEYQLIKKFKKRPFFSCLYFKVYKVIIFTAGPSGLYAMDISDLKCLEIENLSVSGEKERLAFLYASDKAGRTYRSQPDPYLYMRSDSSRLYKLDIRLYRSWANGEGLVCLGPYPGSRYSDQLSFSCKYLISSANLTGRLQLCKVSDTAVEPMGEILLPGVITNYAFSDDDKHLTVVLRSGEVIIVKILDPTKPDLITEVNKLPCTRNHLCETKEEAMNDARWTTMVAATMCGGAKRDNNTLHNFVRNCVMPADRTDEWKPKLPRVGTDDFFKHMNNQKLSDLFDAKTQSYIPTIVTVPLDTETVLLRKQKASGGDNPKIQKSTTGASAPQPSSPSEPLATLVPDTDQLISAEENIVREERQVYHILPQELKQDIESYQEQSQEEVIPANLKLYLDLPTDEREKRLNVAFTEINQKHTAVCSVM